MRPKIENRDCGQINTYQSSKEQVKGYLRVQIFIKASELEIPIKMCSKLKEKIKVYLFIKASDMQSLIEIYRRFGHLLDIIVSNERNNGNSFKDVDCNH